MTSSQQTKSLVSALFLFLAVIAIFFAGVRYGSLGVGEDRRATAEPPESSSDQDLFGSSDVFSIRDTDVPRGSGPILLIEYSDFECPFCQQFHPTAKALVADGSVTWVYRHLPLDFHPTAFDGAVISACVQQRLGGKAFWDYTDAVFASSASPSIEKYRSIASSLGLSAEAITTCLAEGSSERALVSSHVREAQLLGINGTPGSLLVNRTTGELLERLPGALPLESVREVLSSLR